MVEARYKWEQLPAADSEVVAELTKEKEISPFLAQLLAQRGLTTIGEVQKFLKPSLENLADPFLLHDMEKAVDRIETAIANGEKITIYGDYDADGITSTALMYEALLAVGADVNYYVPNRFTDGYGPNAAAYQRLIDQGTQLFVTVDNGVSGKDVIDPVVEAGIDVVITDHHEMPAELPQATAIVHPRYPGSQYPFPDLSGVGVALMVAWALTDEFPVEQLDLVAIGEIADVVSVSGENRSLISFGIQQLRHTERPGLVALMKLANITTTHLTDQDIGFGLAPRLNALGRIADANDGVALLTTLDDDQAQQLAQRVDAANKRRQELVNEITQVASQQAQAPENQQQKVLLLMGQGWHQGVLGIVASRIMEQTGKPVIVAATSTEDSTVAKGSGRSFGNFNLFAALDPHRDLLTSFGGHPAACGLSFNAAQFEELRQVLQEEAQKQGIVENQQRSLSIASSIQPDEVTMSTYRDLQQLAPFGPNNEEPIFVLKNVRPIKIKTMGQQRQHLKFSLATTKDQIDVIAFGQAKLASLLASPTGQIDLVVKIGINEWRGKQTLQLMLEDIQIRGTVIIDQRTNKLVPQLFQEDEYYIISDERLRQNIEPHVKAEHALSIEEAAKVDFANQRLVLVDCPPSEKQLQTIFTNSNGSPELIRLYLYQHRSAYLTGMPSRNDFAHLFRFMSQQKQIKWPSQRSALSKYLKINEDRLNLMIQVFSEAGFVTIRNGRLRLSSQLEKTDLTQMQSYQHQLAQYKLEQQLLFNDTAAAANWLLTELNLN